jgi:hypothetical protein
MTRKFQIFYIITGLILFMTLPVQAAWETGVKAGYDSNVNRTIDNAVSDTSLGAYLQYIREATGETRFDWTFAAALEGNAFLRNSSLSNAFITIAPGVIYFPYRSWSINLSPFLQGKVVSDKDQSALAFGAKIHLRQPLGKYFYLSEYYSFTSSRAQMDVYSFTEHALGAVAGVNWTHIFFTEIGYEFSRGDSFRTFSTTTTTSTTPSGKGSGKQHGYSSTFSTEVYKDQIGRHTIGLTTGVELYRSVLASVSYNYSIMTGDLGTSSNHMAVVSISYRF